MKKINFRIISLLLLICMVIGCLAACNNGNSGDGPTTPPEHIDYVEQTKIDMNSGTLKMEVKVKLFIDGDTTHFSDPQHVVSSNGVIKARYLAVNTPESTGAVEEYGKAASNFTKSKLENAASIMLESNLDGEWGTDSNGRQLVWVWYKPDADSDYRCLNIELLQNGLAVGSSASDSYYGQQAVQAIAQAKREKLNMFSGEKDPLFYYGDVIPVSVKELRINPEKYNGKKIAVTGLITKYETETAFMVEYDEETDTLYGLQVYFGFNSSYDKLFQKGNITRAVGTFGSFNGTWQLSGIIYDPYEKNNPEYTAVESEGNETYFNPVTAETFNSTVNITVDGTTKSYKYYQLALSTGVYMQDLKVVKTYTTNNGGDSDGAITLTCTNGAQTISVRTDVLKNFDGELVVADDFTGKTINVRGVVEYFDLNNTGNGSYQIKVSSYADIEFQ